MKDKKTGRPITKLQNEIFGAMVIITVFMTLLTAVISVTVNLKSERDSIDSNLKSIAYTIANSEMLRQEMKNQKINNDTSVIYLDSLKTTISNVDVISIISNKGTRLYHTNKKLVGTEYDGTFPNFAKNGNYYITNDIGPSGAQRRVYGAIYDENGVYQGFVLVVILSSNINSVITSTVLIHVAVTLIVIFLSVILSNSVSRRIKHKLWGYEPDAFSAMYSVRDNILESFEEGVIAIDYNEKILFMNKAAQKICGVSENYSLNLKDYPMLSKKVIKNVLKNDEKIVGIQTKSGKIDAITNYYPVVENDQLIGAICVLIDRTEYKKIADDLSGVRFLVDSMRANNHDFTNKLHVILGLIQMGENKEAIKYISNITSIQQELISNIMRNIEDPSVAALLIGKYSKAAELNVSFQLENGSAYRKSDIDISSTDLVTVIGNLIENAFENMNSAKKDIKELSVGIFTKPNAMLIRIDDTGTGIPEEIRNQVFEKGITSKGENHGSGLYLVKQIVDRYNGTIEFDTEEGEGTSFTVTLVEEDGGNTNV